MDTTHTEIDDCSRPELQSLAVCLRYCAALLRYPDPVSYATLETLSPVFEKLHVALTECIPAPLPTLDGLQISYTSLFVANPAGLPAVPYVSCRLEPNGQVYGEATIALRNMMEAEGVRLDRAWGEPEDHIGFVFDFAALLAERAAESPEKISELHQVINSYLSPLLPGFAADVARAEPSGFYADASAFCSALIEKHEELLQSFTAQKEY